jgi:hypothetical protein
VVYELRRNAKATGLDWWDTCTASVVVDAAASWPTAIVFAALTGLLREGLDPEWVAGGRSPAATLAVAREWLEAGVEPSEVAGWFRAGCCDPNTAVKLAAAGLRPHDLVDAGGTALHWVEVLDGQQAPVAQAVAEWGLPVKEAVRVVTRGNRPASKTRSPEGKRRPDV